MEIDFIKYFYINDPFENEYFYSIHFNYPKLNESLNMPIPKELK